MDIISVTDDVSIELGVDSWRLVKDDNRGVSLLPLAEYNGVGIKLHPTFASAQRLGRTEIELRDIARISLGWDPRTQSWRLGVLTIVRKNPLETGELAWMELATWRAGEPHLSIGSARTAGESLARLLNKPFQLIEPSTPAEVAEPDTTQPSSQTSQLNIHPIALRTLPLEAGHWRMRAFGQGLMMEMTPRWVINQTSRAVVYLILAVIFLVLAIGAGTAGLAEVSPGWLPLVAYGMAGLLVLVAIETLWRVIARPRLVVDTATNEIRSERALTHVVNWHVPFDSVDYLLVSQEAARSQGRRSREEPMQIQLDGWLHVYAAETFHFVGEISSIDGKSWQWETVRRHSRGDQRRVLDLSEYDTGLHHMVRHIAEKLAVEAYVDIR